MPLPVDRVLQTAPNADDSWSKYLIIGLMFMAQTFPSAFVSSLVPTLFRKQGLALEHFWIFSVPLIPYWMRWALAPIVDSYWSDRLGRRKTWFFACTLIAVGLYASLALFELTEAALYGIVALLFLKSIATATQEVAIDAYVVDNVPPHRRSVSAGAITVFEAFGQMAALVLLGIVVERLGWRTGAVTAALLMLLFLLPAMLRPEPPVSEHIRRRFEASRGSFRGTFEPLFRFMRRPDTRLLIPLLLLSGLFTGALFPMIGPFLVDQGFTVSQVGLITGITLASATLTGAGAAMFLNARVGSRTTLKWLIVALPLATAPVLGLLLFGVRFTTPVALVALVLPTLVTAVYYVTWMTMRLSFASALQAGTDYASAAALGRIGQTAAAAAGGVIAGRLGWDSFFFALAATGAVAMIGAWIVFDRLMAMIEARNREEGGAAAAAP